eukprot:gene20860-291_t
MGALRAHGWAGVLLRAPLDDAHVVACAVSGGRAGPAKWAVAYACAAPAGQV